MGLVAVMASLLGAERLWQRSQFYRKQAALCAFFEMQTLSYAADYERDRSSDSTIEEKRASAALNLVEARRIARLKEIYRRVAKRPWELLPPDTPESVNPLDLFPLTASELEEMVKAGSEE
jgi:hypothetical protein